MYVCILNPVFYILVFCNLGLAECIHISAYVPAYSRIRNYEILTEKPAFGRLHVWQTRCGRSLRTKDYGSTKIYNRLKFYIKNCNSTEAVQWFINNVDVWPNCTHYVL